MIRWLAGSALAMALLLGGTSPLTTTAAAGETDAAANLVKGGRHKGKHKSKHKKRQTQGQAQGWQEENGRGFRLGKSAFCNVDYNDVIQLAW